MAQQPHAVTEQTTRQTVTGTASTMVAEVTAAALASAGISVGDDVLIRVTALIDAPSVNTIVQAAVAHASTLFDDSIYSKEPAGPTTAPQTVTYVWQRVWTVVSAEDINFQIRALVASTTVGAQFIEIVVMSLEGLTYYWNEVTGDTALSTTPLTDGAVVTFTPAAGEDVLVLTSARHDTVSVTTEYGSRIFSSGTFSETQPYGQSEGEDATDDILLFSHARVFLGLGAVSQTFREESFNAVGASSGTRENSTIFALPLSQFKNHGAWWTEADEALQTTDWLDPFQVGRQVTPDVTGDWWMIAQAVIDNTAAGREIRYRLQVDNADQPPGLSADGRYVDSSQDATDEMIFGTQTVEALTASTTYTMDFEGDGDSTGANSEDHTLCAFSFELAGAPPATAVKMEPMRVQRSW